jgi:hypothetical protein
MSRNSLHAGCLLALAIATPAVAAPGNLSAEQIVEKNVAARGGLAAWRGVKTLTLEGQVDAGGKPNHALPYALKQKRPHQSRLEITFKNQVALQVYDGHQGWKLRPFLNRTEVEPFTPDEAREAASVDEFDGPLIDAAAKGNQVSVAGTEDVEGHPAYKLAIKRRDGSVRHVWIDAASFLDVKVQSEPRMLDGRPHDVSIYYRDYRNEHGLMIAHAQDTIVEGAKQPAPYHMTITRVGVNDALDDKLFQKPPAVVVSAPSSPPAAPAAAVTPAVKKP